MTYLDHDIQKDIVAELQWEPSLRDDDFAVGVRDAIVTLGGFVDSFADMSMAERVAGRVKGVRAIANGVCQSDHTQGSGDAARREEAASRMPSTAGWSWTPSTSR